jgi:hypothetical protein
MAWDAADWTIDRATKVISYVGGDHSASPSYVTVIDFRRELGAMADDPEYTGDDEYDIISDTAADRQTDNYVKLINGFTLDETPGTPAHEHIYDGTIEQTADDTRWDGFVNYGNADVQIQIIQDGAVLADDWWNFGGAGLNPSLPQGISHRFMLKTIDAGTDIDLRNLIGTCRRFNYTYAEFKVVGSSAGNNTLALKDSLDLNNETLTAVVATWDQFNNDKEGWIQIDVEGDAAPEDFYSSWDIGGGATPAAPVINDLFEWQKHEVRDGSVSTLYGLNGELFRGITHEIDITPGTGTWVEPEEVTWGSGATAGTGQLLAVDDTDATNTSKMWIQHLTGVVPNANLITGSGTGTAGTVLERPVSTPFNGASTGTAIIGAYGMGVDTSDLTQNDKVFDLTNTPITPPNNVTFTVFGLASGEDYVLATNDDAGGIDYTQMTLDGALTGVTTTVTVNGAIPTDTPSSGTIRIARTSGLISRHPYSLYSGSDFTITSHDFTSDTAPNATGVFISYLDKVAASASEAFTGVYLAGRTIFVRNRDGGGTPIKTGETTAAWGTAGGSATVSRVSDA